MLQTCGRIYTGTNRHFGVANEPANGVLCGRFVQQRARRPIAAARRRSCARNSCGRGRDKGGHLPRLLQGREHFGEQIRQAEQRSSFAKLLASLRPFGQSVGLVQQHCRLVLLRDLQALAERFQPNGSVLDGGGM